MWHELAWNDQNEAHIARHDVSPYEVHEVLNSEPRLYFDGSQDTKLVFGTTYAGRHLFIVLAEAIDGRDYVVTARDMTKTEKNTFHRRK